MKKLLLSLLLLFPVFLFSQTLIPGVQKQYTIAGRTCIVWVPSDTTFKHDLLFSFVGNSTNDSAAVVNQGPAKRVRLSTTGIHRDSFMVVTYVRTVGENNNVSALSTIDGVLDWLFANCTFLSTTDSTRNHMTGLSQGNQEMFKYLGDWGPDVESYTPHHRNKFNKEVALSNGADEFATMQRDAGTDYRPSGTRVWYGSADAVTGTYYPNHIYSFMAAINLPPRTLIDTIVGAGHDNTVWDSAWSLNAATYVKNSWKWLLEDQTATPPPTTPSTNLIKVSQRRISDFNMISGKSIRYLFDGNTTTNINHNGIGQNDLVLPFESWVVLDSFYRAFKVEYYDAAGVNNNLKLTFYRERPSAGSVSMTLDSIGTYNFSTGDFNAWHEATGAGIVDLDSVRFIRISTNDASAFDQTITEIKLYGDAIGIAPKTQRTISGTLTDPGRYGKGIGQIGDRNMFYIAKLGYNMRIINPTAQIQKPSDYTQPLTSYRLHWKELSLYPDGWNTSSLDSIRHYGMHYNHTIVGGSIKDLTSGEAATYDYGIWVGGTIYHKYQVPGADSTLDATYAGLGHFVAATVGIFGNNPTPGTYIYEGPTNTSYGQGGISYIGAINEWIRDWQGAVGHSGARAYYAQLKAIYDSVKVADPTMPVYIGALTSLDSNVLTSLNLVHYFKTQNSTVFPAAGLNFNTYMSNDYGGQGFNSASIAVTPEQYQIRKLLSEFKAQQDSSFGKFPTDWTEIGYDTADASPFNVPTIAGKTRGQTKADWTARVYMLAQSVPEAVSAVYYYWATSDNTYVFGGMNAMVDHYDGPGGAYSGTTLEPVGYMLSQQKRIEENYKWWSTLVVNGDSTSVNVTRQDHQSNGNKKLFQVAMGTRDGSTQSYSLNLGANVTSAKLIQWSYSSEVWTETPLTITGTNVTVTAAEKKIYVEATYNEVITPYPSTHSRFRWKRN